MRETKFHTHKKQLPNYNSVYLNLYIFEQQKRRGKILDGIVAYRYHNLHCHHHHLYHLSTSLHFAYSFLESDALQVGRYFSTVCLRHQGKVLGSVSHPITLRLTLL